MAGLASKTRTTVQLNYSSAFCTVFMQLQRLAGTKFNQGEGLGPM